ncbi:MAG: peroxiredoxin family protein [Flavobacteriales bacterium]|nr:peroxiredoxin family protein [Flavobacteriales bacterium]
MTRQIITYLTIMLGALSIATEAVAQYAPNFSVTDINGQDHHLYQDYLQNNQVVVIGMIYVGAPLVDEMLPALQDFAFESWDEEVPVQFMMMSGVDDDEAMQELSYDTGFELPMISMDGGADDAIEPYMSGEYGVFFGYPMFVVIGPDASVVYDPWGETMEETMEHINQAILQLLGVNVAESVTEARPTVYPVNGGMVVQLPDNFPPVSLTTFALDGRILDQQQIQPGQNFIEEDESGVVVYQLNGSGVHHSGKILMR